MDDRRNVQVEGRQMDEMFRKQDQMRATLLMAVWVLAHTHTHTGRPGKRAEP